MGNEFEVYVWTKSPAVGIANGMEDYFYDQVYAGDNFEEAIVVMKTLKEKGAGCVKFEWR